MNTNLLWAVFLILVIWAAVTGHVLFALMVLLLAYIARELI